MKQTTLFLPLVAAVVLVAANCQQPAHNSNADMATMKPAADPVKRGEYLVTIMGCEDCHSPKIMTDRGPVPDPALRLSGHPAQMPLPAITDKKMTAPGQWVLFNGMNTAAVGPWGTSFAANLTPDESGMGNWTLENFKKALTQGKSKGMDNGRMLLPPMPWPNYTTISEEDLAAVFAYLNAIPPVKNVVPAPIPPTM